MRDRNIKAILLFFLILIFVSLSLSQEAAETVKELENRLKEASSPTEKLGYLGALMETYMQKDPGIARDYGRKALHILQDFPDDRTKVKVLLGICGASCMLGEYREALDMGRQAETLARKINDRRGLTMVFANLANIYHYFSDYHKALDYALKAKTISEELGFKNSVASALVSIARVQRNLKEYEKALTNYKQALKISQEMQNKGYIASILSNMAHVYCDSKKYQKALDFYFQALKMMEELKSEKGIARMMHNIACVYSDTGRHALALQYDKDSLRLSERIKNRGRIAFALGSIGRDYGNLKDYTQALDYMGKSLNMAADLGRKDIIKELYKVYMDIYEAMGDYKKALLYHKKFKETSDEILNEDRSRQIAHLRVVYDAERKEKENQLLKKNNHIQKLRLNFLALVLVLVLIIALVTYNRYRIRKKAEQVLRVSEQKLKKMNAAKDKLFTIISHDLGSPLNSLLLSAGHLKNHFPALGEKELKEFINNIYKQTQDMSDLLENLLQWAQVQIGKLEQNPEAVDIRLLTEETIRQLKYTAQKKKIHLGIHITKKTTVWADKHMMKTVVRNLLSNAIKYTYPGGEVQINSKDTGEWIEITVSDNGMGIPEEKAERLFREEIHESSRGTSNEKGTGLGLVLCREFVEKNGGQIRVHSRPQQGSSFSFTLPKQ